MKNILKKAMPLLLIAAVLSLSGMQLSCGSSSKSHSRSNSSKGVMYERHQSNKGHKVKSNIKVKGTNKANGRTTRSY